MMNRYPIRRQSFLALVLVLPWLAAALAEPADFDAVLAQPSPAPDLVIQWGRHPAQRLEQYRPAQPADAPVAVLVHGGCWLNAFDMGYMRPLAAAMAERGWVVWSLGYRRLGDVEDAAVRSLADIHAGLDRIATQGRNRGLGHPAPWLIGHSAGGHLALLAAGEREAESIAGVVGLAAITDIVAYADQSGSCNAAATRLLEEGGRDAEELQPAGGLPAGLPVLLVRGDLDPIVDAAQTRMPVPDTRGSEQPAPVLEIADAGHFEPVMPDSEAFRAWISRLETMAREDE